MSFLGLGPDRDTEQVAPLPQGHLGTADMARHAKAFIEAMSAPRKTSIPRVRTIRWNVHYFACREGCEAAVDICDRIREQGGKIYSHISATGDMTDHVEWPHA